jgi:hypothetical protein
MKIEELMQKLDLTEAEAKQLIADDMAIYKGVDLFPLTKEQKQAEKKMRAAGKAPTAYKFTKRERKADNDKQHLINLLTEAVGTPVEIINAEREFTFIFNNKKYKVVLSAPRT